MDYIKKLKSSALLLSMAIVGMVSTPTYADVVTVGPGMQYTSLQQVETVLSDGDTLRIAPGVYRECAILRANNLQIKPLNWETDRKAVRLSNVSCEGKGILVIKGNNTHIEGLEFSNARVPDENGAGIRLEGGNLTLKDTGFYNNENGILAVDNPSSTLRIENSRFIGNGKCGRDCAHGIYIGKVGLLEVIDSEFRNQKSGHHIKSRALRTQITNNQIVDGDTGTASYLVDLSNGGSAVIEGNDMQKGPASENYGTAICIACEGDSNRGQEIVIKNNNFRNDVGRDVVFVRNRSGVAAELQDNHFDGSARVISVKGAAL